MIEIQIATPEGIDHVTRHLHPSDERELVTVSGGMDVENAMRHLVRSAGTIFSVHPVFDGKRSDPVSLFGVAQDERNPGWGVVWLMSTRMLRVTSADILKLAPVWLNNWLPMFKSGLHNIMDARNERHIEWVLKMGAKFDPTRTVNINGFPFRYFSITNPVPAQ